MAFQKLLQEIAACTICAEHLPHGPRPVLQAHPAAPILIAGQAPGRRVHESGVPFDDPSGDRLRLWMGLDRDAFYDPSKVAIVPMGFCYPGTGASGDHPPRPECAPAWREAVLEELTGVRVTLILGAYAQKWHMDGARRSVTEAVMGWKERWPDILPLPHPSPRNRAWFSRNPWFDEEVVPALRARIAEVLSSGAD